MKIVIAIDSSESAETVISEIVRRSWPEGSEFRTLTVLDLFALPSGLGGGRPVDEADAEAARTLLSSATDRLALAGLKTGIAITEGYPPTSIIEFAGQWGADFIIVGSEGQSGITRFLLGSVALDVVRRAPCSVGIVRRYDRNQQARESFGIKILLCTDGSRNSIAAARSVADRPWPEASEVRVLCVAQTIEKQGGSSNPDNLSRAELTVAEKDVETSRKLIADSGLKASGVVLLGSPKERIIDDAKQWGADLIVIGSHGRRGFLRLFMGSVSEAVAMHAHCSVDVIRIRENS